MSRRLLTLVTLVMVIAGSLGSAHAADSPQPNVDPTTRWTKSELRPEAAEPQRVTPFKDAVDGVFLVHFAEPAVATYTGGTTGFTATSPDATGAVRLDVRAPGAVAYAAHLEESQEEMLTRIEEEIGRALEVRFRYLYASNGIAAEMSPDEATTIAAMQGVALVTPDRTHQLHTDDGPRFIGAPGVWGGPECDAAGSCGEGVVVGILDSGINPSNPSFSAVGPVDSYVHRNPLTGYLGACDPADPGYDPTVNCNDKLVGVWDFTESGPLDDDGHGSHTASTVAGNLVVTTVVGNDDPADPITVERRISGVAPHANIIAYDVCVAGTGCPLSAIEAAINQAVVDGVHVINHAIGGGPTDPWTDPVAQALLGATAAGVFVAASTGNAGPGPATIGSPADAPWVTSVGASTHARSFPNTLEAMTGGATDPPVDMIGRGFTDSYGPAPIVYAGDFGDPLCLTPFAAGTFSNGEIVVCDRGEIGRVEKGQHVATGGAGGYVLANDAFSGNSLNGDAHSLPAVHIGYDDGIALKTWLTSGTDHSATIGGADEELSDRNGDVMAAISGRGPNPTVDILSPHVTAPGVDIIAAHGSDDVVSWGFLSGSSMSSSHVAGAAALLTAVHPDWTPAQIRSALMTTAATEVSDEDGTTPADWFDMGSGSVRVDAAAAAGLLFDERLSGYQEADPGELGDPTTINLPSGANSRCVFECEWTRTVEAATDGRWTASVVDGNGMSLTVEPGQFSLEAGETQEITIRADVVDAEPGSWVFGEVVLAAGDAEPTDIPPTRLPIATLPTLGELPGTVAIDTRRDAGSWPVVDIVALEITDLTARIDGLVIGTQVDEVLAADSDNSSPYDDPTDGAFTTLVEVNDDATTLFAETLFSEAADLDLYVGFDANGDGIPTQEEEVCVSATGSALEYCRVTEPAPGTWWILVQNWSGGTADALTLSHAVLDGRSRGNMWVRGPETNPELTPFGVRVEWNDAFLAVGDKAYAAVHLGTDPESVGNIGSFLVELNRHADDVSKTADPPAAEPGDTITFTIAIAPNVSPEDLRYTITDAIPEGMSYIEGSATGGATFADGVVSWSGTLDSPYLVDRFYVPSTSLTDPLCDTGFGGYVDLESFGIPIDPSISGDTVAYRAFAEQNPIDFYGVEYEGLGFTDDGFAFFGDGYAGSPWLPQVIPDPAAPNNVAAALWSDFEILADVAANDGVTLATAGPDVAIIEYDGLRPSGGSDPALDMNIVVAGLDPTPGFYEVVFAYDNIDPTLLPAATIGLEDADGAEAVVTLSNSDAAAAISDGFQVCYDWSGPELEPTTFSFDVTVDADTLPGPVTNEVVHATDDPGSVATITKTEVGVLDRVTAGEMVFAAHVEVTDLADQAADDDAAALADAETWLLAATDTEWWVDGNTLVKPGGARVYKWIRKAINSLQKVPEESELFEDVEAVVASLVAASAELAAVAIDQASASGEAEAEDLEEAAQRLENGVKAADQGLAKRAVKRMQAAWRAATRHLD